MSLRPRLGHWRLFALGCIFALAAGAATAQDPRASAAQAAARSWLALADKGDANASWTAGGKKFQEALTPENWALALSDARAPLGALTSRAVLSTRFTNTLPGGSEGDYALIVFETNFEKKGISRESVTLERGSDGTWRVIGYFIR
jgi:hypothetical protein